LRADGAGVGERQADLKPEMGCGIIERGNLQRVVLFGDDNTGVIARVLFWRVCFTPTGTRFAGKRISRLGVAVRELALDSVGGQARQPQAENTPPVSRKGTHHISIP
jgi:hypothetical protein